MLANFVFVWIPPHVLPESLLLNVVFSSRVYCKYKSVSVNMISNRDTTPHIINSLADKTNQNRYEKA